MRVTRACARCDARFETVDGQGARFCSGACFLIATTGGLGLPRRKPDDYGHWCEVHWAPVRDDEALSQLAAPVVLLQVWMDSDGVARRNPNGHAGPEALGRLARQDSPLCCWLGDRIMRSVYAMSRTDAP